MIGSVLAMLLNVVLNYVFIPMYGYVAAGFTTLVCYAIQAFIDYLAMRIVFKETVYDMKKIYIMSATMLAVSLLSAYLYDYSIVRYVLIGFVGSIIVLNRKTVYEKIKLMNCK